MGDKTIGDFLDDLQALNLEDVSLSAIEHTADKIVERNKAQLYQGLTSEGNRLRPYRSYTYARAKNQMNPVPGLGNPDFYVTGQFYQGIQVEVVNGVVGVHSYDSKAPKLEARDGADRIYGLDEDQGNRYIEEDLTPVYLQLTRERLKLPNI